MNFESGLDQLLGTEVLEASGSRVVMQLTITAHHLQPAGLVHGGIYAALAESAASIGASLNVIERGVGAAAMGIENHTSFLRSVGEGTVVRAEAVPRHAGRRLQAWSVTMTDQKGRELALSSIRLHVAPSVPAGTTFAGSET
jgi:1,4-dihydroxy-2-naphthoyl-CoA hydrolase